jgi:hypothetical protein
MLMYTVSVSSFNYLFSQEFLLSTSGIGIEVVVHFLNILHVMGSC